MRILKFKNTLNSLVLMLIVLSFSACSKSNIEKAENDNTINTDEQIQEISAETNISESEDDILKTDYKEFYDQLSPFGEWVEVSSEEINISENSSQNSENQSSLNSNPGIIKKISLANLLGINDAVAADINVSTFFVWKPAPDMAVSVSAGTEQPAYVPYSNGQWLNTEQGWYFKAPTPHEEIVHHYGRWINSPALGWVWVPGNVWAPAWVDWRVNDNYIAWTPVPPSIRIVAGEIPPVYVTEYDYVVVEKKYFFEPVIYKYTVYEPETIVLVKSMKRPKGLVLVNNMIINRGPEIEIFDPVIISTIPVVKIHKVKDFKKIGFKEKEIYTYTPVFKKIKNKNQVKYSYFKPEKFSTFKDAHNNFVITKEKNSAGNKNSNREINKENNYKEKDSKFEFGWKKENNKNNDVKKNNKQKFEKSKDSYNEKVIKNDMPRQKIKNDDAPKKKNENRNEKFKNESIKKNENNKPDSQNRNKSDENRQNRKQTSKQNKK